MLVAVAAGGHGLAQSPPRGPELATTTERTLAAAGAALPGARVSFVVIDLATGRSLAERDADLALNPASNTKIFTAAAALATLGAGHRFNTSARGRLSGDAVLGHLVLRGDGDPTLTTADLRELARQVSESGAREVRGDVVVDDSALGAEHLPPAFEQRPDEAAPFRAAVSAVAVDESTLSVRVRPGAAPDAPAQVAVDPRGYVAVAVEARTVERGQVSLALRASSLPDGREALRVTGTILQGAPVVTLRRRVERPSLATAYAFREALIAAGVSVRGAARVGVVDEPDAATLASRVSAPLSTILYAVGKDSNNFTAETVLLAVAAGAGGAAPTFARGVERVLSWARGVGVNTAGLSLRNGSGLYDANRASARQLAQALRGAWRDARLREEFVAQLAVAGEDGTLRRRLRGARGVVVRAKTGTLDDAVALSGYVLGPDPRRGYAFAFVANGVRGRAAQARALADALAGDVVDVCLARR